jgi:hypothetical protein
VRQCQDDKNIEATLSKLLPAYEGSVKRKLTDNERNIFHRRDLLHCRIKSILSINGENVIVKTNATVVCKYNSKTNRKTLNIITGKQSVNIFNSYFVWH